MELHPVAVATLEAIAATGQKPYHLSTPQAARSDVAERLRAIPPRPHPDIAEITNLSLPSPAGPLAARRYQPAHVSGPGAIVYAHGGGWVFGAPDMFDPLCSGLAAAAQRPVMSVDYRLAPETPFPGPLEDMIAAVHAVAAEYGGIVVAGDSAGGNLAAATALTLAERVPPPVVGQLLFYPVLAADFGTPSYREHGDAGRIISTADMRWFWDQYAPGHLREDWRAAPLLAPRLDHLPPAYIAVAGWDPLRDDGARYAARLAAAGVDATLDERGDMIHGFCSQAGMLDRADAVLARAGSLASNWLDAKNCAQQPG